MVNQMIDIFTDGSSTGRIGPGGWAFIVVDNGQITYRSYGGQNHTTNNQMEIYAVTQALKHMHDTYPDTIPFTVWSDSQYVVKGINEYYPRWEIQMKAGKKKIKNEQFWLELKQQYDRFENIELKWLKGHAGNAFNDEADRLAKEGKNAVKLASKHIKDTE